MTLTIEQEHLLAEMLEAYKNGKKISDLPAAPNPSEKSLQTEVIDKNGNNYKLPLTDIKGGNSSNVADNIVIKVDPETNALVAGTTEKTLIDVGPHAPITVRRDSERNGVITVDQGQITFGAGAKVGKNASLGTNSTIGKTLTIPDNYEPITPPECIFL